MSAYIGLVYNGQPDLGQIKSMARQYGAYDLALYVAETGVTLINVRLSSVNRGFAHKTWTLEQLGEAIAYYDALKGKSSNQSPRCVLVSSNKMSILPESLDITLIEVERPQEKPVPQTPRERWEALFRR